ncbi:unnamed protein product, partial [Cylicostephanus goldi]
MIIFALLLYGLIVLVYFAYHLTMMLFKPLYLLIRGMHLIMTFAIRSLGCTINSALPRLGQKPKITDRISAALAIVTLLGTNISYIYACQHVNILEYRSTICTFNNERETCSVTLSEILKINTLKQEACLRLTKNSTSIANIKIKWKGLYLHCDRETLYATRTVQLKVHDSKRCAHMGSCTGGKCAQINSSSLIPELEPANHYPGRTGCFESCGGPGCDCFYLSSGCLFYRIYAVPQHSKIYELFRCMRWTEEIKLEVTVENIISSTRIRYVVPASPNLPVYTPPLHITMTSVTLPPTPSLATKFITDGIDTAIWDDDSELPLHCQTRSKARNLNCTLQENCKCAPAESTVNCECEETDIDDKFHQIDKKLPVKTASWELRQKKNSVSAKISHMVTAEFIIELNNTYDMAVLEVTNRECFVESTSTLEGCYNCRKGAVAKIQCYSEKKTLGE